MAKIEAKLIQKELENGKVRPIYWLFGPERMKARELTRRIEQLVFKDSPKNDFNFEKFQPSRADGVVSLEQVWDSWLSISLMGGTKLVLVQNAEELKNLEALEGLLKSVDEIPELAHVNAYQSILVFQSSSFDSRRKWAKALEKVAAVVPCEAVAEYDREPWIDSLAKRRGLVLTPNERMLLRGADPWSLDLIDMELSKLEILSQSNLAESDEKDLRENVILQGVDPKVRDQFIDAVFTRNRAQLLKLVTHFSSDIDIQLPLLGLLAWNLRQLKQSLLEQEMRYSTGARRNPYLEKNLDRWKKHWKLSALQELEHGMYEIDFHTKNTRHLPLGLWVRFL